MVRKRVYTTLYTTHVKQYTRAREIRDKDFGRTLLTRQALRFTGLALILCELWRVVEVVV